MCDGAGRLKEPVKLGVAGGEGSPGRVVNIGRSRLRVDHLGQFYVLDSEDEGTDTEAGLYVPDSEGEDGDCHGCGSGQVRRHASLVSGGFLFSLVFFLVEIKKKVSVRPSSIQEVSY
jgi:hypothetical protein